MKSFRVCVYWSHVYLTVYTKKVGHCFFNEKVVKTLKIKGWVSDLTLLSIIWEEMLKTMKDDQKFELFTLIGEDTFSSGVMHAAQLQHDAGAILVGMPTGGNVYFYANTNSPVKLPNSKVTITCSTGYVKILPGYSEDVLQPDILVKNTIQDYISGVDKEVQTILKDEKLQIDRGRSKNISSSNTVVIEKVAVQQYDDGSPYLHDIVLNDSDRTIIGFERAMLAFDKDGKPLELYWQGPDGEKTYLHTYVNSECFLQPGDRDDREGGWSLYVEDNPSGKKNQTAYALYNYKSITFSDGRVWNNPEYDEWEKTYLGKEIAVETLQSYYPAVYSFYISG